jgi:hypothetical protein
MTVSIMVVMLDLLFDNLGRLFVSEVYGPACVSGCASLINHCLRVFILCVAGVGVFSITFLDHRAFAKACFRIVFHCASFLPGYSLPPGWGWWIDNL